jgi:hypothetical protein
MKEKTYLTTTKTLLWIGILTLLIWSSYGIVWLLWGPKISSISTGIVASIALIITFHYIARIIKCRSRDPRGKNYCDKGIISSISTALACFTLALVVWYAKALFIGQIAIIIAFLAIIPIIFFATNKLRFASEKNYDMFQ